MSELGESDGKKGGDRAVRDVHMRDVARNDPDGGRLGSIGTEKTPHTVQLVTEMTIGARRRGGNEITPIFYNSATWQKRERKRNRSVLLRLLEAFRWAEKVQRVA